MTRWNKIIKHGNIQKGFSLIELLVVLLIIGFGIGMVAVNIGVNDNDLRIEAKQFANYTAMMTEEAIVNNQQWGVDLFRTVDDSDEANEVFGYRWLQRVYWTPPEDSEELSRWLWLPVQVNDIEPEVLFAAEISLQLEMEDIERQIDDKVNVEEKPELQKQVIKPDIYLMGNGEISPFLLKIYSDEGEQLRHQISGDLLGRIRLDLPDEDE